MNDKCATCRHHRQKQESPVEIKTICVSPASVFYEQSIVRGITGRDNPDSARYCNSWETGSRGSREVFDSSARLLGYALPDYVMAKKKA